ncbi:hypothetical protein [Chloroflexus sp.]|uniref:hypothetical protein n=1 Tax=Chloroflexus sp. TaxID=1904827 RepID=UPI00298EFE3F|nr:hypothetical protein [Chloroflexus sp.]MDW8405651.1 hypothetical protein [Chloroflexus sp.]
MPLTDAVFIRAATIYADLYQGGRPHWRRGHSADQAPSEPFWQGHRAQRDPSRLRREEGLPASQSPPHPVTLAEALEAANHLVILGEPGAGDSTTLQFLCSACYTEGWVQQKLNLTELCAFAGG